MTGVVAWRASGQGRDRDRERCELVSENGTGGRSGRTPRGVSSTAAQRHSFWPAGGCQATRCGAGLRHADAGAARMRARRKGEGGKVRWSTPGAGVKVAQLEVVRNVRAEHGPGLAAIALSGARADLHCVCTGGDRRVGLSAFPELWHTKSSLWTVILLSSCALVGHTSAPGVER